MRPEGVLQAYNEILEKKLQCEIKNAIYWNKEARINKRSVKKGTPGIKNS